MKISLLQCYEVLWIHNIDAICIFQCTVEAFPFPVNYWERHDGRLIQHRSDKYQLSSNDFDGYKTELELNVTLNEAADFGTYYCISKNEKGLTKAAIELFGKNKTSLTRAVVKNGKRPLKKWFGSIILCNREPQRLSLFTVVRPGA